MQRLLGNILKMETLEEKNAHIRDKDIVKDVDFLTNHKYFVRGDPNYISVSKFVKSFFPEFNNKEVIAKNYAKWQKDTKSKYYGLTPKQILTLWHEKMRTSSENGTNIHKQIEEYLNYLLIPSHSQPEFEYFLEFVKDYTQNLENYRVEMTIFDEESKICGTLDMLYRKPNGKYILVDWKTSKDIVKFNMYGFGFYPLAHISDCNYMHYSLQLNLYKYILEKHYGLEIQDLWIVQLREENKKYNVIECEDLQNEIKTMLDWKCNQ